MSFHSILRSLITFFPVYAAVVMVAAVNSSISFSRFPLIPPLPSSYSWLLFEERRCAASGDSCQVIAASVAHERALISSRCVHTQTPAQIRFILSFSLFLSHWTASSLNIAPLPRSRRGALIWRHQPERLAQFPWLQHYYCFHIARPRRDRTTRYLYLPNSFPLLIPHFSSFSHCIPRVFHPTNVPRETHTRIRVVAHADRVSDLKERYLE